MGSPFDHIRAANLPEPHGSLLAFLDDLDQQVTSVVASLPPGSHLARAVLGSVGGHLALLGMVTMLDGQRDRLTAPPRSGDT